MCNLYNTANASVGCRTNYNTCYANNQRMCRDANGNVWVRVANDTSCQTSCCHCCNHCCHSCCSNGSGNGNTSQNDTANGGYGCITLCGVSVNGSAQNITNGAMATPRCARNRCGCGYY